MLQSNENRPTRYNQLIDIAIERKIDTFLEIGAWKGKRAVFLDRVRPGLRYYGFDVWEEGTPELDENELNGKERVSAESVSDMLREHNITYELYRGLTKDTLPKFAKTHQQAIDMIFIDGGHSHETIKNDFHWAKQMIKPDGCIIFDDYYLSGPPEIIDKWGCRGVLEEQEKGNYYILNKADQMSGVVVAFAMWEPDGS